jgi:dTDP-4-amino-4,6-dideoxygalactose transaminase
VFADIGETFNIDPVDVAKKITHKTRAIIVQHTFGIPAAMNELAQVATKYNLFLIEDCAHALGATYQEKKVGTFGDAAFFSFGRDKVISSVFGGLAIISQTHPNKIAELKSFHKKLENPRYGWIFQQLFHPVAFLIILPLYRIGIGKALLILLQRLRLLGFPVYREEKSGRQPDDFPAKYPNALALLLLNQLKKLERFTKQRREISRMYGSETSYMRFPKIVDKPRETILKAKKQGILLGDWYHNVIDPFGVDFTSVGYIKGSCPRAEDAAKHIINLPTRVSAREAKKVLAAL